VPWISTTADKYIDCTFFQLRSDYENFGVAHLIDNPKTDAELLAIRDEKFHLASAAELLEKTSGRRRIGPPPNDESKGNDTISGGKRKEPDSGFDVEPQRRQAEISSGYPSHLPQIKTTAPPTLMQFTDDTFDADQKNVYNQISKQRKAYDDWLLSAAKEEITLPPPTKASYVSWAKELRRLQDQATITKTNKDVAKLRTIWEEFCALYAPGGVSNHSVHQCSTANTLNLQFRFP
jgi:hypothetical protein